MLNIRGLARGALRPLRTPRVLALHPLATVAGAQVRKAEARCGAETIPRIEERHGGIVPADGVERP